MNTILVKRHINKVLGKKDLENIEDYKYVIESKILKEFKGRKKYILNIPNYILEKIFDMFKSGVVIDFEKLLYDSVYIYYRRY